MSDKGQVISEERFLVLQLVRLYKACRIEMRASKNAIAALAHENAAIGAYLEEERQRWIERAEHAASSEFRAIEAALLDQKPYLSALRVLLGRHQPKRAAQSLRAVDAYRWCI